MRKCFVVFLALWQGGLLFEACFVLVTSLVREVSDSVCFLLSGNGGTDFCYKQLMKIVDILGDQYTLI